MQKKQCQFCNNGVSQIDYKDTETLKKYSDSFARIINKRQSGVCALHQRSLAQAIKRARILALVPFIAQ